MKSNGLFLKNISLTLSRHIFSIIIGLILSIVIARSLGPTGQGIYALIILLPTLLSTFFNFGIGVSSVYYIGKNKYSINVIIKTNIVLALLLSFMSILFGLIIVHYFADLFFPSVPTNYLYLIVFMLPIIFLNQFLQAIFQGKEDFKSFNFTLMTGQSMNLLLAIFSLTILSYGIEAALFSFVAGQFLMLMTIFYLLNKKIKYRIKDVKFSFSYLKDSLNFGLKAHVSNILAFLNYRADLFLIAYFLSPLEVGLYTIAVNISERLWVLSQAISTVLYPRIAALNSNSERSDLTSVICRNMTSVSLLGGVFLIMVAEVLIILMFGEDYRSSILMLQLLIPGIIFGSTSRIIANDFAGRGKPELNMNVSFFTVTLNISLNILLIPLYGANGAAVATSISYFINWMIKIILFKKISGNSFLSFLLINGRDLEMFLNLSKKLLPAKKEV